MNRRGEAAFKPDRIASAIAGPLHPFTPGHRLTTRASWFTTGDDGTLVVVVPPDTSLDGVSEALAYGLAWQQDADLALIIPTGAEAPTLHRLSFIGTPVRVWTYGDDGKPRPQAIPTRDEAVRNAEARWLRGGDNHDLGDRSDWVAPLTTSADAHWALTPAHRTSYLAWHCAGRQVLRISRSRGGVRIQAGVQYKAPPPDRRPIDELLSGPVTSEERAQIEAAVAVAVADRLGGLDAKHVEHQMQAALAAMRLESLGLVDFAREYPAWRGDGLPGFIDFLGIDDQGVVHVVETKIGSDPLLVLQALDYAIWVIAHEDAIRKERGRAWEGAKGVAIDFVLAPKGSHPALGPYTASQLEALAGDLSWVVHLVADPRAEVLDMMWIPHRQSPDPQRGLVAEPVRRPRFAARVQQQLLDASGTTSLFHAGPQRALLPEARDPYTRLVEGHLAHRYALHLRSSQAFALTCSSTPASRGGG